jgi:hypothetical protein
MTTKASHFPMFLAVVGCRKLHSNYSGAEEARNLAIFRQARKDSISGWPGSSLVISLSSPSKVAMKGFTAGRKRCGNDIFRARSWSKGDAQA